MHSALAAEIEAAERDRLTPDLLAPLLLAHRTGCELSRERLVNGLRHLAYPGDVDLLGNRWVALTEAIDRLRPRPDRPRCKGPLVAPDKVDEYVASAISRVYHAYRREVSADLLPPSSTASDRKKQKKPSGRIQRDSAPMTNFSGSDMTTENFELRDHLARTPEEERVYDALTSGMTYREIAAHLGMSKHRVETFVALFRRRFED